MISADMLRGLWVTAAGMGIVFASLVALLLVMIGLGWLFRAREEDETRSQR
ncbi:MAG: OadG family protein [Dehalococcoidia bacterium]